jgi:hypothetical protein
VTDQVPEPLHQTVGQLRPWLPLPHVPEDTRYFSTGSITLGVEMRTLEPDRVRRSRQLGRPDVLPPEGVGSSDGDGGVTVHVFDSATLDEYLRFDCFVATPHYHYVVPGPPPHHVRVLHDTAANGAMLDWTFTVLRNRLGPLLEVAGGSALLGGIDPSAFHHLLDEVEAVARQAAA